MKDDATPALINEVPLPLYERHLRFMRQLGQFLHSEDLSPHFRVRLGSNTTVTFLLIRLQLIQN
jgi:hypothetical protein